MPLIWLLTGLRHHGVGLVAGDQRDGVVRGAEDCAAGNVVGEDPVEPPGARRRVVGDQQRAGDQPAGRPGMAGGAGGCACAACC